MFGPQHTVGALRNKFYGVGVGFFFFVFFLFFYFLFGSAVEISKDESDVQVLFFFLSFSMPIFRTREMQGAFEARRRWRHKMRSDVNVWTHMTAPELLV